MKVVSLDRAVMKGLCEVVTLNLRQEGRKEGRTQKGAYSTISWAEGPVSRKALWREKRLVGSKL